MNTRKILMAARDLIEQPECWIREYYAFDAKGEMVEPVDPSATCFCMLGAIAKVSGQSAGLIEFSEPARILAKIVGEVPAFNDLTTTTHADVIAAFDKAIQLASDAQVQS